MLGTIQFHDQSGIMALKVDTIVVNDFLTQEPSGIIFQKIIPQVTFLFCHCLSEHPCSPCQIRIVLPVHCSTSDTAKAPLPKG